jgi:hypothetical protein
MKAWLTLWGLLLRRPIISILLAAVYLATALLVAVAEPGKRGALVVLMSAFVAGCLTAVLSERIRRHSLAAGSLGIPGHARLMQQTQALFLVLFVAAPGLLACALGTSPLTTGAVLLVGTAVGIALSVYGFWWLMLVPALGRFDTRTDWLSLPITQAAGVAASGWLIWHWFELPERSERIGQAGPVRLADSRHERARRKSGPMARGEPVPDPFDSSAIGGLIPAAAADVEPERALPAALAMGLGYSLRTDWRLTAYGAGAGVAALAGWHVLRGGQSDVTSYVTVSAVCCVCLVARLQSILQRWMRTSAEQAILRIAPLWPDPSRVKRAILQSTFVVQRGPLAGWAAITLVGWTLDLVPDAYVFRAALALAGTSLAFSGSMWATLARRQVREWHAATVAIVVLVASGALVAALGSRSFGLHMALGLSLMVAAPAAALVWYLLAPARVPLSVDPRALPSLLTTNIT